jgi:hypothetical protein
VFEHDRFDELASLAAIGELSPAEFEEFELHKQTCRECRDTVAAIGSIARTAFLAGSATDGKSAMAERHQRLRASLAHRLPPVVPVSFVERRKHLIAAGIAAAFVLGAAMGAGVGYRAWARGAVVHPVELGALPEVKPVRSPATASDHDNGARLQAALADMQQQIDETKQEDTALREKLTVSDQRADAMQAKLSDVENQSAAQAQEAQQARNDLAAAQGELTQTKHALSASQTRVDSLQYELADRKARLTEASVSLDRERQLLSEGREIRNVLGARDLHIVDVVDRDGKGRIRKAFGRAFFTEGKSLTFFAFDLPTKSTDDGKFVYAAWGSNSNNLNGKAAHSLGIFYNDDKTLHRWAIEVDDPKVLQEIDTVFVTLEPAGKPFASPSGKPLLEAYFGTPPNHP